jgi:hypothetical protein
MSVKRFYLAGLAAALLGLGQVRAQAPSMESAAPNPLPNAPTLPAPAGDAAAPVEGAGPLLSSWILYPRSPGCCGPVGAHGPIYSEVYVRNGVAVPIGGGFLNRVLDAGWDVEGGIRSLFFNADRTGAWVLDIGVSNVFNPSQTRNEKATLRNVVVKTDNNGGTRTLPTLDVGVVSYNRTNFNVAWGSEWYLLGCADNFSSPNWRVGADVGGRYGSAKINLDVLTHRTDTVGGVFVALHSDLEIPCGGCIFIAGARAEWDYIWSDILQTQNRTDVQDLTLILTLGARY